MKKITLIGTDSTHCTAFAELLNYSNAKFDWQIAHALRDINSRLPLSIERMPAIERKMSREFGIEIVDDLESIKASTDAYIIASVDASLHLKQFEQLLDEGKPVFIDKPITYSLQETHHLFNLSEKYDVPVFSSSSLRFSASLINFKEKLRAVKGVNKKMILQGPLTFEKGIPGMFWYGIHILEMLVALLEERQHIYFEDVVINNQEHQVKIKLLNEEFQIVLLGDMLGEVQFEGKLWVDDDMVEFTLAQDELPLYYYLIEQMLLFFENSQSPVLRQETEKVISLAEMINNKLGLREK